MTRQELLDMVQNNKHDSDFLESLLVENAKIGDSFGVGVILPHVDPHSNAYSVIVNATTKEVIDLMLRALNNTIPRGLNVVLRDVACLEMLEYLLRHARARFNVGYHQYECVRVATLNGDVNRVNVFLNCSTVNIHASGRNTMDKTCVELAVVFNYSEIVDLFIARGLKVTHAGYSDRVNRHVIIAEMNYQQRVSKSVNTLVKEYTTNNCKIPYDYINSSTIMSTIFPHELSSMRLLGKISTVLNRMENM